MNFGIGKESLRAECEKRLAQKEKEHQSFISEADEVMARQEAEIKEMRKEIEELREANESLAIENSLLQEQKETMISGMNRIVSEKSSLLNELSARNGFLEEKLQSLIHDYKDLEGILAVKESLIESLEKQIDEGKSHSSVSASVSQKMSQSGNGLGLKSSFPLTNFSNISGEENSKETPKRLKTHSKVQVSPFKTKRNDDLPSLTKLQCFQNINGVLVDSTNLIQAPESKGTNQYGSCQEVQKTKKLFSNLRKELRKKETMHESLKNQENNGLGVFSNEGTLNETDGFAFKLDQCQVQMVETNSVCQEESSTRKPNRETPGFLQSQQTFQSISDGVESSSEIEDLFKSRAQIDKELRSRKGKSHLNVTFDCQEDPEEDEEHFQKGSVIDELTQKLKTANERIQQMKKENEALGQASLNGMEELKSKLASMKNEREAEYSKLNSQISILNEKITKLTKEKQGIAREFTETSQEAKKKIKLLEAQLDAIQSDETTKNKALTEALKRKYEDQKNAVILKVTEDFHERIKAQKEKGKSKKVVLRERIESLEKKLETLKAESIHSKNSEKSRRSSSSYGSNQSKRESEVGNELKKELRELEIRNETLSEELKAEKAARENEKDSKNYYYKELAVKNREILRLEEENKTLQIQIKLSQLSCSEILMSPAKKKGVEEFLRGENSDFFEKSVGALLSQARRELERLGTLAKTSKAQAGKSFVFEIPKTPASVSLKHGVTPRTNFQSHLEEIKAMLTRLVIGFWESKGSLKKDGKYSVMRALLKLVLANEAELRHALSEKTILQKQLQGMKSLLSSSSAFSKELEGQLVHQIQREKAARQIQLFYKKFKIKEKFKDIEKPDSQTKKKHEVFPSSEIPKLLVLFLSRGAFLHRNWLGLLTGQSGQVSCLGEFGEAFVVAVPHQNRRNGWVDAESGSSEKDN